MASEYRCGFSNELEFSLINYLSKMLCDSNRRLSKTRITARCQIIHFPLVFPAPEILKHNSQNDLPIPSSISCPKPEVTTTLCRVQGPSLTRPGFCICLTSFSAFDATLFLSHWHPWLSLNWNAWFWSCLSAHVPVVFLRLGSLS